MAMTLDGQFQRSYGIPHPPGKKILILLTRLLIILDIHRRYEGHTIVIEIITCFGPKFFKIKAIYVEDDPILVDPYLLLISYALDAFGHLPDVGEIVRQVLLSHLYYNINIL
jgi:hypothetical protein